MPQRAKPAKDKVEGLYRRTGKCEQAQEHLTTASSMYREMGMTYWLEQATQQFETT
jgi:hypothetical protein